jgi:hypothetical protein
MQNGIASPSPARFPGVVSPADIRSGTALAAAVLMATLIR